MTEKLDLHDTKYWPSQPHIFNFNGEELDLTNIAAGTSLQKDNTIVTRGWDGTVTVRSIDGSVKPQRFIYARTVDDLTWAITPPMPPWPRDPHREIHRRADARHIAKERWKAMEMGLSYEDYTIDEIAKHNYEWEQHSISYYGNGKLILPLITEINYETEPALYYPTNGNDDYTKKKVVAYFADHPDELATAREYFMKRAAMGSPVCKWELENLYDQITRYGKIYKSLEEYDKMYNRSV